MASVDVSCLVRAIESGSFVLTELIDGQRISTLEEGFKLVAAAHISGKRTLGLTACYTLFNQLVRTKPTPRVIVIPL